MDDKTWHGMAGHEYVAWLLQMAFLGQWRVKGREWLEARGVGRARLRQRRECDGDDADSWEGCQGLSLLLSVYPDLDPRRWCGVHVQMGTAWGMYCRWMM